MARMANVLRPLSAILAASVAGGVSIVLGAGTEPALFAGAVGFAGAWFSLRPDSTGTAAPVPVSEPSAEPGLEQIIAAIDDPMLVVERLRVRMANAAALDLLGTHIVGEDVRLAIRHPAAAALLAGSGGAPVELPGLGERERRWELGVHALPDGRLLARLADRSGMHAAERMRVDFVANASHELRTPLATLIGFIETLEDRNAAEDGATRSRFLGIMSREAKRMQRLVEDLMSLSRIEAEKYSLPQTEVDLLPLVDEVRMTLHTGTEAARDRIIVDAARDIPKVAGDRAQLSQLLYNVIGNALKYGRPGTPVTVRLRARDGLVRLAVSDEGDGIAPEHLPRLTERFYRVDPGRSRAMGGTGLGLAIVKHIVERHRGRLEISSEVGHGTKVLILLPQTMSSKSHESVTGDTPNRLSGQLDPA
jgi:two-component system phosphate regulon sensor histidine kinase PhoR